MSKRNRDYKQEYRDYHGRPEQIEKRSQRNQARRKYEAAHGDLPRYVDVDHKRPIREGGGNDLGNLRAESQKKNRGWRRGE